MQYIYIYIADVASGPDISIDSNSANAEQIWVNYRQFYVKFAGVIDIKKIIGIFIENKVLRKRYFRVRE